MDLTPSPPEAALGRKQRHGEWAHGRPGRSLGVSFPVNRWPLEVLAPGQPSVRSFTGTWSSGHTSQLGGANSMACGRQGGGAGMPC